MRNDGHAGGVRFTRNCGEEVPFHVLGQLYTIGLPLQRGDGLFRIRRSFHSGQIAACKCSTQAVSVRLISDSDSGTEVKAWPANLSGVQAFLDGRLPCQRVTEIVDGCDAMSQKHLAHIRTVMDVRIDQSGVDELAAGIHDLRTGFQDRRSFRSAPYSADDVAFNQNTDVRDWCLARSIYQGCALNQKIFGTRVR